MRNDLNDGYHITNFNYDYSTEYYSVQSVSQDVLVNPDGVSPSVVLLFAINLKVFHNKYTGILVMYASNN